MSNTLEILDSEIPRLKTKIEFVLLCFTTDPFMYGYDDVKAMSIAAIKKLNVAGTRCTVLTKGVLPIELVELSDKNEYGVTLISLDEDFRKRIEPGAVSYAARIAALKALSDRGCRTWVSIEPYPTPNLIQQDLVRVLKAVAFTNRIIFGRTNYNKEISAYTKHKVFYNEQTDIVIRFCNEHDIAYYIKNGTFT